MGELIIIIVVPKTKQKMSKTESSTLISICPSRGKCGEERDVQRIMEKFKDFYENKLNEIDAVGNGDTLEVIAILLFRFFNKIIRNSIRLFTKSVGVANALDTVLPT